MSNDNDNANTTPVEGSVQPVTQHNTTDTKEEIDVFTEMAVEMFASFGKVLYSRFNEQLAAERRARTQGQPDVIIIEEERAD